MRPELDRRYCPKCKRSVPVASIVRGRCAECRKVDTPTRIYAHRRWRTVTRPAVLERDGNRCHYCGQPAHRGEPLDVAHIRPTGELLAMGADVFDPALCVAAHRTCHNRHAPHLDNAPPIDR